MATATTKKERRVLLNSGYQDCWYTYLVV